MPVPNFSATVEHFAARLSAEHAPLAREWLERLDEILAVEKREVFPTHQLLDHIPDLIREIAVYLRAPADQEIAANTAVMTKAAELGLLRFDQRASVHQLMREYQIFSEILETFFAREAAMLGQRADATAAVLVVSRAQKAVRVLQQKTVDAFIARYTEAIERRSAQLRAFSRLLSHEIRQPLGVLQVLARVLLTPDSTPETARLSDALGRNVTRLGEVADKLERLARLTRPAKDTPHEPPVDLAAIVLDITRQLQDMMAARGVVVTIDPDLPILIGDVGRLELVFVNLLANAVKYSDPDKPHRTITVERDASVAHPRVVVRDNGIGIPEGKLEAIFEQFVRAHAHLDDELGAQGMGLGLAIVRESMDALDGTIAVTSAVGTGTTFTLDWPRAQRLRRETPATPSAL